MHRSKYAVCVLTCPCQCKQFRWMQRARGSTLTFSLESVSLSLCTIARCTQSHPGGDFDCHQQGRFSFKGATGKSFELHVK